MTYRMSQTSSQSSVDGIAMSETMNDWLTDRGSCWEITSKDWFWRFRPLGRPHKHYFLVLAPKTPFCPLSCHRQYYEVQEVYGPLQGPPSSWRPFRPLDFVLCALRSLKLVLRVRLRSRSPFLTILDHFDHVFFLPFLIIFDHFDHFGPF